MRISASRQGFTLIELLTVIAIMAILSSMIFPSMSRAREMARRSSCASNMKQLDLAFMQYKDDYDGRFPGAGQWQKWAPGKGHWVAGSGTGIGTSLSMTDSPYTKTGQVADPANGAIYPYVKSTQIYVCPSNKTGQDKKLSYSMNCSLAGMLESGIENQTDVALLVDEEDASDGFFYASADTSANLGSTDHITVIHNGGGNYAFMDGHVKFYPFAVYPIGDNKDASAGATSAAMKTRTTGQPRFYDSANAGAITSDLGFGSCTAP